MNYIFSSRLIVLSFLLAVSWQAYAEDLELPEIVEMETARKRMKLEQYESSIASEQVDPLEDSLPEESYPSPEQYMSELSNTNMRRSRRVSERELRSILEKFKADSETEEKK